MLIMLVDTVSDGQWSEFYVAKTEYLTTAETAEQNYD